MLPRVAPSLFPVASFTSGTGFSPAQHRCSTDARCFFPPVALGPYLHSTDARCRWVVGWLAARAGICSVATFRHRLSSGSWHASDLRTLMHEALRPLGLPPAMRKQHASYAPPVLPMSASSKTGPACTYQQLQVSGSCWMSLCQAEQLIMQA